MGQLAWVTSVPIPLPLPIWHQERRAGPEDGTQDEGMVLRTVLRLRTHYRCWGWGQLLSFLLPFCKVFLEMSVALSPIGSNLHFLSIVRWGSRQIWEVCEIHMQLEIGGSFQVG